RPGLTVFRPGRPNGAAVLIAAGGGYRRIEMGSEAVPAARWLNTLGITAFVLSYRLPGEGWGAGRLAPFQDARRALRLVRYRAGEFRVDPQRIGVLGFSSGGHLMGMTGTRPEWDLYAPVDAIDTVSDRVALSLLIYPVITLEPPFAGTRTRRVLVGDDPSVAESAAWSVQTYVRRGDAPFFLVQAADDPVAAPDNTKIMQNVCQERGVSVVRHLFPAGGHGFGVGRAGTLTTEWPGMANLWMRGHHFME
ncbi:alpha/beta hydrolase, partial [Acetobacter oeni]